MSKSDDGDVRDFVLRLPTNLVQDLDRLAKAAYTSRSAIVRQLIATAAKASQAKV
jgi:metal-responsive CopG/Arc/MetJ family transcriptional regulator